MLLTIASGKGGTGKTTVATNLAVCFADLGRSVDLLDCDVEEPNCHFFLRPEQTVQTPVNVAIPVVRNDVCTGCGECAEICQFNALACLPQEVMVFPELCHSCAGCWLVCPEEAIAPGERAIGEIEQGQVRGVCLIQGRLRVGEAVAPPLIRRVIAAADGADLTIIDAPPGTSCPVVAAVQPCDYAILVTEPTPFGLNDLILAVEMVRKLGRPFGVILNRADSGDRRVHDYCHEQGIRLLMEIPHDLRIAEAYSRGRLAIDVRPQLQGELAALLPQIEAAIEESGS
jgi:MinD superfamily P-loop ATPase